MSRISVDNETACQDDVLVYSNVLEVHTMVDEYRVPNVRGIDSGLNGATILRNTDEAGWLCKDVGAQCERKEEEKRAVSHHDS